MIRIGIALMIFGIGSMILNSFGYEFKILMWMGEGAGIRIGIAVVGLALIIFGAMQNKKEEEAKNNNGG